MSKRIWVVLGLLISLLYSAYGDEYEYEAPYSVTAPIIDGVVNASEWENANSYAVTCIHQDGTDTKSAAIYFQHDDAWLYVGVKTTTDAGWDAHNALSFDGNNDCSLSGNIAEPHVDVKLSVPSPSGWSGYRKYWYCNGLNAIEVAEPTGTSRGSSGATNVNYEYRIKLSDLTATTGDTVGFYMSTGIDGVNNDYEFPLNGIGFTPVQWANITLGFPKYTLTLSSSATGFVTNPGEGDYEYEEGTVVPISANPNTGYVFDEWTGTAVDAGKVTNPSAASTTVIVDANYTLEANFVLGDFSGLINVALQANGGTATAESVGTYQGVTYYAHYANDGVGREDRGWANSWSLPTWLQIEFDAIYTISRVGIIWGGHNQTFSVSVSEDGQSWSTVVSSRESNTDAYWEGSTYHYNTNFEQELIDITPCSAKYIRMDITTTSAPSTHIFKVVIQEFQAYTTETTPTQYQLSVISAGNGFVTGSGTYDSDSTAAITATPNTHYHFVDWTGTAVDAGKVVDSSSASTTVTMDADYTLQANFAIDQHTLTMESGEGGAVVSPGGGVFSYDYGSAIQIEAKAEEGYRFKNWGGNLYTTRNPYTLTLKSNMRIKAVFEAIPYYNLQVSSTAGGQIVQPTDSSGGYIEGSEVAIEIVPVDPNTFDFVGWVGSAVQAGNVSDPNALSATVTMSEDTRLVACFSSQLDELHVDDNAANDLGPGDLTVSDPNENGTEDHPLDSIQEAIVVAKGFSTILVHEGTYWETINFLGKPIDVNGLRLSDMNDLPVIDANYTGPVVTFASEEDPNCQLSGFILTRGLGIQAGAIDCNGASPLIRHCIIVGNRCYDPNEDNPLMADPNSGVIYCCDSNSLFEHCTISGNYGGDQGAVFRFVDCNATLLNSIVWGNGPQSILVEYGNDPNILYCDIEGLWSGLGNVDADPHFVMKGNWIDPNEALLQEWLADDPSLPVIDVNDPAGLWIKGDYHLCSEAAYWDVLLQDWVSHEDTTSPCIDAGDPNALCGKELGSNVARVNVGAYGNTSQASWLYMTDPNELE